jgi:hypothetical protein
MWKMILIASNLRETEIECINFVKKCPSREYTSQHDEICSLYTDN